jgi:transposase
VRGKRGAFRRQLKQIPAKACVVVDESATTTTMIRTHGRASPGVRVHDAVPLAHWRIKTLAAAVRLGKGVTAALAYDGPTDTAAFESFACNTLAPTLRRGDVVIWDNLQPHRIDIAREAVEARGARVLFLPPYSPDYSPIEPMWSKVKQFLRSVGPREDQALIEAIGTALQRVTPEEVRGYFEHCGYVVH